MQIKVASSLLLVLVLAACGGSSGATSKPGGGGATSKPAATSAGGTVDCAAIKAAAVQLLGIQLLAQIRTPDTAKSIMAKEIGNLDPDALLAALAALHALDGHASSLGDPKAAIEVYEKAARAAKVLFATDPITQEAIDAYNLNVGDVATFLGHQAAISGAIGEAGC